VANTFTGTFTRVFMARKEYHYLKNVTPTDNNPPVASVSAPLIQEVV
jgi:hypothetical protein